MGGGVEVGKVEVWGGGGELDEWMMLEGWDGGWGRGGGEGKGKQVCEYAIIVRCYNHFSSFQLQCSIQSGYINSVMFHIQLQVHVHVHVQIHAVHGISSHITSTQTSDSQSCS